MWWKGTSTIFQLIKKIKRWCVCVRVLSRYNCVWLFATPWTVACRFFSPWDSPGKNTGMGCCALPGKPQRWRWYLHLKWRQVLVIKSLLECVYVSVCVFKVAENHLKKDRIWAAENAKFPFCCARGFATCLISSKNRQHSICLSCL